MRLFARVLRLVWGSDVDGPLRPVLAVQFVGSAAGSAVWVFIGIWAKEHLGASDTQLGLAFLGGALLAGLSSYVGGHISDYVGRRPLIIAGWGGQAVMLLGFIAVGTHTVPGLIFAALAPAMGAVGQAADTAMVADLVPPARQEQGYAAVRVASNLGVTLGPPIGGALLLADRWPVFFIGGAVLAATATARSSSSSARRASRR